MNQKPSVPPLQIILFAALPQEMVPFKKRLLHWRRMRGTPSPAWESSLVDRNLLLMETGMGPHRLSSLFEWAVNQQGCDLLISFGFGGGLIPELRVGDLCLCDRFVRFDPVQSKIELPGLAMDGFPWRQTLESICPVKASLDVTTPRMMPKQELRLRLTPLTGSTPALVDMETHYLATCAQAASIPFLALRSISDALEDDLHIDLSAITNENGQLEPYKLATAMLRQPSLLRSFFRLWRHSRKAGEIMGIALAALMSLPREHLAKIIGASRLEPWRA